MTDEYYSQIKPEDVWLFPKVSSVKQHRYYDRECLVHPAKMPTFFVQKIISEYSKPGDLVLDPMAGIGTTLIEAVLLGRNAIGVEYEQKFVSIVERNIKSVEVFRGKVKGMGRAAIFKGDSRRLSKVLGENSGKIDSVVCSPPYSGISLKTGVDLKGRLHARLFFDKRKFTKADYKDVLLHDEWDDAKGLGYSKDSANIGNLPHGKVDAVITSPPFMNANEGGGIAKSRTHSDGHDLSMNARKLSEDKKNIDNMKKYGKVDAIISSPPYADMVKSKPKTAAEVKKAYERCLKAGHKKAASHYKAFLDNPKLLSGDNFAQDFTYGQGKENIGNKKYGKVDSIISSPPYGHPSYITQDQAEGRTHKSDIAPDVMPKSEGYGKSKDNIGNQEGETYLDAMLLVYKGCFDVLKGGGAYGPRY